jgi:actin-like ATPase involved in cell morphogenesis
MKIFVQVTSMMIGGNKYKAFIDYVENGENKTLEVVNRTSMRELFKQIGEVFGDRLEELYAAKITGEFDEELTGDDLLVWETPIKKILSE